MKAIMLDSFKLITVHAEILVFLKKTGGCSVRDLSHV